MKTFAVQLTEIRWLTAYIDAKNSAAAIRQTRQTWSKVEHSAPLPFALRAAKLIKPSAAAQPIALPSGKRSRRRSRRSGS